LELSAEEFATKASELGLVTPQQMSNLWSQVRQGEVSLEEMQSLMLRKELMTKFQVDRLLKGETTGYFYGDYKVLYMVGAGTFARVYRASHKDTKKIVAVKVLRKRFREDINTLEQFLREGTMGIKLRHPNVVPIYEVNTNRRNPYMILEFVEGSNLREFAKVRGKLDFQTATNLIVDIVQGLHYAGEKGITHRDLKMSNVLITSHGKAKLVDFGLAAAFGDNKEVDSPNARTIDYAALERCTGVRKDDLRSDIYFAGCVYYNMLAGVPPLLETRDRLLRLSNTRFQEVKPILEHVPDLPRYMANFIGKAMELSPAKRFQTTGEMLAELKLVQKRLQAGEVDFVPEANVPAFSPNVVDQDQQESEEELEGQNKTVMIIESDVKMQNVLRERLKKRGYRVLVFSDPYRGLARFEDGDQIADIVVFCAHELGGQALDAFNTFAKGSVTQTIPAILLINERQQAFVEHAALSEHHLSLTMPIKVNEFRTALRKLLFPDVAA
jgi:serine/threonine protein kinase